MASPPAYIPDTQLGLNPEDVQVLRYAQHQANSTSRAASAASSQGRLLLDPSSLQQLNAYFDRVLGSIQQRWAEVSHSCQTLETANVSSCTIRCRMQRTHNATQPGMPLPMPMPQLNIIRACSSRLTKFKPSLKRSNALGRL
jgi:molybdopterin-biosynthesis enzyme MoeA-like protein